MSDEKLRLYTRDPHAKTVERELLERSLRNAGLIGRTIETTSDERRFRPGERFVDLVRFDPPQPDAHCTIEIPESLDQIDFLGGSNVQSPDCPHCGIVMENWKRSALAMTCDACESAFAPWEADWHHSNAFGRYTVDIHGIGLGDAVPSNELLVALEGTNGVGWDYFYYIA